MEKLKLEIIRRVMMLETEEALKTVEDSARDALSHEYDKEEQEEKEFKKWKEEKNEV